MLGYSNTKPLDKFYPNIFPELSENSRVPVAELSRRVNLSRNGVRSRLSRLEANQKILRYTIDRGRAEETKKTVASNMIERHDHIWGAKVTSSPKKISGVKSCFILSGGADLMLKVEAEDSASLQDICAQISYAKGVKSSRTHIVLATLFERDR